MRKASTYPRYFVYCFLAALAALFVGYTSGIFLGTMPLIRNAFSLEEYPRGVLVSIPYFSAAIGALATGRLIDHFGRKPILIFLGGLYIYGSIHTSLADHVNWFVFGQFMVGASMGMGCFAAPIYIAEISPKRYRGAMISFFMLSSWIGLFLSFIVSYLFFDTGDWRLMFSLGIIPTLVFFVGTLFLPESPRYLILMHKESAAKKVFEILHGKDTSHRMCEKHIEKIALSTQFSPKSLLRRPVAKVIGFSFVLSAIQQCTGINAILYFVSELLANGMIISEETSLFLTVGVSLVAVLFTGTALFFIDVVGRRSLLIGGLGAMTIGLFFIAYSIFATIPNELQLRLSLIGMVIFIAGYSMGAGPIVWIYIAELIPLGIRGVGASVSVGIIWFVGGILVLIFLPLVELIGNGPVLLLFSFISFVSAVLVYLMAPETADYSLEAIEENLLDNKHIRELGQEL